jgi:hypothetical protein
LRLRAIELGRGDSIFAGCIALGFDDKRSAPPDVALQQVSIRNLRAGDAVVDLALQRLPSDVRVELVRREGNVEILVVK